MAGLSRTVVDDDDLWSVLENINSLKLKKSRPGLDLELDLIRAVKINEEKLNCLFVEFLSLFYKQVCGDFVIESLLNSRNDNGENVDLLKLFLAVRERGGYQEVSKSGLWQLVAKECGFDSRVISKLKLVYFKYLDLLDRWLSRSVKREYCEAEVINKISYLITVAMELSEVVDNKKKGGECSSDEKLCKKEEDCGDMSSVDEKSVVEDRLGRESEPTRIHIGASTNDFVSSDNFSTESVKDNDIVSESSAVEEHLSNKKRKRENNSGILKWMSKVARDPCDMAIGSLPERGKWKSHSSEHLWKQVLLAREALFLKHPHAHWKNKPMHPVMFEDSVLGCRQRTATSQRLASVESRRKLRCISSGKMFGPGSDSSDRFWLDKLPLEGSILVGPEFQADVPEWNGEIGESDPKWLGTQIWPLGTKERNIHLIERERIGKGRQDTCGCEFPGSVECIRFHISERRKRVKLELGAAYYGWEFDQMGEAAASSWTKEEEERFHDAVKSTPFSTGMHLFEELSKVFPGKDMMSLVGYYFNVFLLHRRAEQNRNNPNDIDSDDEGERTNSANDINNDDQHPRVPSLGLHGKVSDGS